MYTPDRVNSVDCATPAHFERGRRCRRPSGPVGHENGDREGMAICDLTQPRCLHGCCLRTAAPLETRRARWLPLPLPAWISVKRLASELRTGRLAIATKTSGDPHRDPGRGSRRTPSGIPPGDLGVDRDEGWGDAVDDRSDAAVEVRVADLGAVGQEDERQVELLGEALAWPSACRGSIDARLASITAMARPKRSLRT
jgi:hypothetical protein